MQYQAPGIVRLREFIVQCFDLGELQTLCFDLSIRYDDLGGEGKISSKAQQIVLKMGRSERLGDLLSYLSTHRPQLFAQAELVASKEFEKALYAQLPSSLYEQERIIPLQLPPRPENFTNRSEELKKLLNNLRPGNVITLWGPGGVGKTALVAEALHQLTANRVEPIIFTDGIVFHDFHTDPLASQALEHIARSYREVPEPSPGSAARRILSTRKTLLILDGSEAADDLTSIVNIRGQSTILITSRRRQDSFSMRLDILPLKVNDSVAFLKKSFHENIKDMSIVKRICELAGGLPLALRLITRYINHQDRNIGQYLAWLEHNPIEALNLGQNPHENVAVLLTKSMERISQIAKLALSVIGILAPTSFDRRVITYALNISEIETHKTLGELVNYGILLQTKNRYETAHSLIHAYLRRMFTIPDRIADRVISYYVHLTTQQSRQGPVGYGELEIERPHIMKILGQLVEKEHWSDVNKVTYAIDAYLNESKHWTDRLTTLKAGLTSTKMLGKHGEETTFFEKLTLTYGALGKESKYTEELGLSGYAPESQSTSINSLDALGNSSTEGALIAQRYEVWQSISGGMGLVYLCRDRQTDQLVALKTFKPEYLPHRHMRDLFLREGTMWVDIGQHPHVVRAYRVERVGDGLEIYLVLEWIVPPLDISRPSLRAWITEKSLSIKEALTFGLHISRGMKHAVGKIPGLVHKDLKPENVLIGYDGNARVTDFGLATTLSILSDRISRFPNKRESFMRTQVIEDIVGTPLYMAPEQWVHQPLDARADIYAFGCILYEMITGEFAIYGESRQEIRDSHLTGDIKPPSSSIPNNVIRFLQKCLMTQRHFRFKNWSDLELALERVYQQVTSENPPPEPALQYTENQEERLVSGHSYNSTGLSYLDIGKLNVAIMYFEQAVWIGREEDSKSLEGAGLGNLGRAYMMLGYRQRAIEFYEEQLAIARELADLSQEGEALGNLGQAYQQLQALDRAIISHERELHLAQEIGNQFREAAALNNLGDTYWRIGDTERAVLYYKQSLAMARQIEDRARVKSILSSMGQSYLESGDVKEAVALLHQALHLARRIGDRVGEGVSLGDLGLLYQKLGYQEQAIKLYNKAIQIARESDDRRNESRHLTRLGDIYAANEEPDAAQAFYEQGAKAAKVIGDQVQELRLWLRLGDVYLAQNWPTKAITLLKKALHLSRQMNNMEWIRLSLYGLGIAYQKWGDMSPAIRCFQEYLSLLDLATEWEQAREIWHTIGRLHRKTQQYHEMYQTYQAFLEQAQIQKDDETTVEAQLQIGDVYRRVEEAKKAVDAYKDALSLARDLKDREREAKALSGLGLAYYDMGRNWHAGRHLDKAVEQAEKTGDEALIAMTRYKLALVLYKQKKWSKALPHAEAAQQTFQKLGADGMAQRVENMITAIEEQTEQGSGFLLS